MAYSIGPFQNIVAVNWGNDPNTADVVIAEFAFRLRLSSDYFEYVACHPTTNISVAQQFFSAYEVAESELFGRIGTLYNLIQDGVEIPLADATYAGIPDAPGIISSPGPAEWGDPTPRLYITTSPAAEVNASFPQYNSSLNPTINLLHKNWLGDAYCDFQDPIVEPLKYENSGYLRRELGPGVPISDPTYFSTVFTAFSESFDLSSFSVTITETGKTYNAFALRPFNGSAFSNRFQVLCQ